MEKMTKENIHRAKTFNFIFRYIDDLICFNNSDFNQVIQSIYPSELDVKKENHSPSNASYLDLLIRIKDQQLI